jgi:hypothetical protein
MTQETKLSMREFYIRKEERNTSELQIIRASLGTPFSQGILIFPRENELISLGKIRIPWKNGVPKLALNGELPHGWNRYF